jgi:hypothetical protein
MACHCFNSRLQGDEYAFLKLVFCDTSPEILKTEILAYNETSAFFLAVPKFDRIFGKRIRRSHISEMH